MELIRAQLDLKVSTRDLNKVVIKASLANISPRVYGTRLKLNYVTQVRGRCPTFAIFCNDPELLYFSYSRFIENEIRSNFGITKVPITVIFKKELKNMKDDDEQIKHK
jgi:GTP-binding protein